MNPTDDDPDFARRRLTFGDPRDDYDDDFGRSRSPLAIARRRLLVLGIAHIAVAVAVGIWTLLFEAAYVAQYLNGDCDVEEFVLIETTILAALLLVLLIIAGGDAMVRLRRRRLAMVAAYIIAALSVPFFFLGIWAILLLSRPDVRQEFARLPVQSHDDH